MPNQMFTKVKSLSCKRLYSFVEFTQ